MRSGRGSGAPAARSTTRPRSAGLEIVAASLTSTAPAAGCPGPSPHSTIGWYVTVGSSGTRHRAHAGQLRERARSGAVDVVLDLPEDPVQVLAAGLGGQEVEVPLAAKSAAIR